MEKVLLFIIAASVDAQIRLSGPVFCSGRVEILNGDSWGTVCDDSWGVEDAEVVCRQLGCGRAESAPGGGHFGPGTGQIWLDEVQCKGNEGSLFECPHNGIGKHNCGHDEDAGVVCQIDAQIRLSGPVFCSGRVEILHGGSWGTVCDDSWDVEDAEVVCRQVGCGRAVSAPGGGHFGPGTGQIWLDEVRCKGNERSLFECPQHGIGKHNCGHDEDAGVVCQKVVSKRVVRLRLVGNSSVDLNDTPVLENLLQQLTQRLKERGVTKYVKLSWREQSGGKIFQQEKKKDLFIS